MTFDPDKIARKIREKAKRSLKDTLIDGTDDLQKRLDSGKGTDGRSYKYSNQTTRRKGKRSPVDFTDTGTLRRSIDYTITETPEGLKGRIGIKDVRRGRTSNTEILKSLIKRFPKMWGFSRKGASQLVAYFKSNF